MQGEIKLHAGPIGDRAAERHLAASQLRRQLRYAHVIGIDVERAVHLLDADGRIRRRHGDIFELYLALNLRFFSRPGGAHVERNHARALYGGCNDLENTDIDGSLGGESGSG